MENTQDNNSNSGSDISDSWAVIDDESSLEWNNVIGLGLRPHQNDFIRSISTLDLPSRSNSRNQLSDEESIEVVAEDSTDDLSDKDIEVVQEEECTVANQLETKGKISTGTIIEAKPSQQKSEHVQWTESSPILITILALGILVGLFVGYLCAPHSQESEASTSFYPTQALLKKLKSDNQFLRWRLRSAHAYMKSTFAKAIPNLNHISKQDSSHIPLENAISQTVSHSDHLTKQYLHNNMNLNSLNLSDSGTCSITEFMVRAPMLHDYCLLSEKPQGSEYVSTTKTDRNASNNNISVEIESDSSSMNTSFVKDYMQTENTQVNYNKPNEPLGRLQDSHANDTVHGRAEDVASDNSEGETDPRPYTKHRTTVEKIYTILSILDNEKQTVIPSKEELLSILPDSVNVNDLSKEPFSTNAQEIITSFEMQIQDTTQKLLDDMDSFITSFIQNIALKINEVEGFNKKLICDLKTNFKKSADLYVVDLNRITIFQKCIEEEPFPTNQSYRYDHIVKSETQPEIEGSVSEKYVASGSITSDQKESVDSLKLVEENEHIHRDYEKGNVQQYEDLTEDLEFGETNSVFGRKMSPAPMMDNLKEEDHVIESPVLPIQHEQSTYLNYKSELKLDEPAKEIKMRIMETDKKHKTQAKHQEYARISKHGKSGKKRKTYNKEREYNESRGKTKYSDNGRVKISKHRVSDKKTMSDTKEQKYEAHRKTKYYSENDGVTTSKHGKSGKRRFSETNEENYDKAFGETKYSHDSDHVKINQHRKSSNEGMYDTKEQKYNNAFVETNYSVDNDHVKISKHGKSGKKRMTDNKEHKYNESHGKTRYSDGRPNDSIKISKHEKSGKKIMHDYKKHKYFESNDKTRHSDGNDHVKIRKYGKSGKKRLTDNKEYKYNESHGKTRYSDGNDRIKISKHEKSGKKIMRDNKKHKYFESNDKTRHSDGNDHVKIRKYGKSGKKQMSDHKEHKYNEANKQSGETKNSGDDDNVLINNHEESGKKRMPESEENKYSNILDQGHKSRWWTVDSDNASDLSGEWVSKLAHGRAEQRRRDHESDWVFDRAESRNLNRKKSNKHLPVHHGDRVFHSGVCNKTATFKDEMSKNWKVMKQCMKENIWKPLVTTATSSKKAFNKFRYHIRRE